MTTPQGDSPHSPRFTNRLAGQTSPYLLKHAHNPVDWYPWGSEAFERARAESKPIHLSIGYSACHWCSVLEHESFEDEDTAQLLNERFVNIKVDREERPDIDRIYQIAQQLLTQRSGGWPLTMFLTPEDRRPFFGGTYFPKEPRYGMPSFREVLRRVSDYYREHPREVREQNAALMQVFGELEPPAATGAALSPAPLEAVRAQLAATFDRQYGGFGRAPKFPHAATLELLLRRWHASLAGDSPDSEALAMATLTLRRMGEGGLTDQLGGGFFRYSVDAAWMIPHFEKMLYDNGSLLAAYAQAALATGEPELARIAERAAQFALDEFRSPAGGFYSSFDADSEGHEGRYYVWERGEVSATLTADEYAVFAPHFGIDREPNFEGRYHLHTFRPLEELAAGLGISAAEARARIDSASAQLLARRGQRTRPARDDKILTAWNALMIRGLAIAARSLDRAELAAAAARGLELVRSQLWRGGRLIATAREGVGHLPAYLDDYVYLADAILELQQVRFVGAELAFARELIEVVLAHFADSERGGFYFTADEHEQLMHRPKSFGDDATPAGNGIAARVLQRLGHLYGEPRLLAAAEGVLRAAWSAIERHPAAHIALLLALEELIDPPQIVIVRGRDPELAVWRRALAARYAPRTLVLAVDAAERDLPPELAAKAVHPSTVAYVCVGSSCSAPIEALPELLSRLAPGPPAGTGIAPPQRKEDRS